MNFIDLFAGAGGLSEGFIRAGYKPIAHVEMDKAACFTLKTRLAYYYLNNKNKLDVYVSYLKGKISRDELYSYVSDELLDSVINEAIGDNTINGIFRTIDGLKGKREIDAIVGGPPCQSYSLVGRARDDKKMVGDERNYLYKYYGRFLKRYKPKVFIFENVRGLTSAEGGKYFKNMLAYFRRVGYELDYDILNAKDFGVLQNRRRILLIGWKKGLGFEYPKFNKEKYTNTVDDILSDLAKLKAGEGIEKDGNYIDECNEYLASANIRNGLDVVTQHIARPHTEQDKEIYRIAVKKWGDVKKRLKYTDLPERLVTHKNKSSFLDRFKIVAKGEQHSQTVVAHIAKDGHYYIHPDILQNRSISVREAARLQSFPDDYYFEGIKENSTRTAAFKQIGNAVPPLMAEKIAARIKELLS